MMRSALMILCGLALPAAVTGWCEAGGLEVIAQLGDPAPGGDGTFSGSFETPSVNASAEITFRAQVSGTSGGAADGSWIIRGTPGSWTAPLKVGQAPPDLNGTFSGFGYRPGINAAGTLVTVGYLQGTSGGSNDDSGIYAIDAGGTITEVLRENDPDPDGDGDFSGFEWQNVVSEDTGKIAFRATLRNTSKGKGIYCYDSGTLTGIVRSGDAAPDADGNPDGTFYMQSYVLRVNNSGEVAFQDYLSGTSNNYGIFRGNGSTLTSIVRKNDPTPDGNGTINSFMGTFCLDDSNRVWFAATLSGTSGGGSDDRGLFYGSSAATLSTLAREGGPAPGGKTWTYLESPPTYSDDLDLVAFSGWADGVSGIYVGPPGGTYQEMALHSGRPADDGNGSVSNIYTLSLGNQGKLAACYARFSGTLGGNDDAQVLFLTDAKEAIEVIRQGDPLLGSQVKYVGQQLGSGRSDWQSLMPGGRVAFQVELVSGKKCVMLYTPDLHWRGTVAGGWDTDDNWTLGLKPAEFHAVILDPDSDLTIAGPTAACSVESLQLAPQGSAKAELVLQDTGPLSIAQGAGVASGGTIGGDGAINGDVALSGGVLSPASGGALAISGSLSGYGVVFDGVTAGSTPITSPTGTVIRIRDLDVGNRTATIYSQDAAELGPSTTLGGGTLACSSGVVLGDGDTLSGHGTLSATVSGHTGSGISASGGTLIVGDASSSSGFSTGGTVEIGSGATLQIDDADLAELGSSTTLSGGTLAAAHGLLVADGATLDGHGLIDGKLSAGANSLICASGGNLTLGDGSVYDGFRTEGTLDVGSHTVTLHSKGFARLGPLTTIAGGQLSAPNGMALGVGDVLVGGSTVSGRVAAAFGSIVDASDNLALGDAAAFDGFYSDGVLEVNDHEVTLHDRDKAVLGSLTEIDGGGLTAPNGILLEEGKTLSGNGDIYTSDDEFKNQGYVFADDPAGITFHDPVTGRGDFAGPITFLGGYSPGDSPALIDFGGDVTFGDQNVLTMELGGTVPGSEYDVLQIAGTANLDGTLEVLLIDSFEPQRGDLFQIMTFAGAEADFDSYSEPELGGGLYFTHALEDQGLTLMVVPEPSALALLAAGILTVLWWRRRKG